VEEKKEKHKCIGKGPWCCNRELLHSSTRMRLRRKNGRIREKWGLATKSLTERDLGSIVFTWGKGNRRGLALVISSAERGEET